MSGRDLKPSDMCPAESALIKDYVDDPLWSALPNWSDVLRAVITWNDKAGSTSYAATGDPDYFATGSAGRRREGPLNSAGTDEE